jgi:hypothetical protein
MITTAGSGSWLLPMTIAIQTAAPVTGWSFWVATLANLVNLAQALALMFGVFQLWAGRAERKAAEEAAALMARKDANYQAWQVINSAQGKGGSGGRVDALQELAREGVSLAGVCLDGAWLAGVRLEGAHLIQATFRDANLAGAGLEEANLERADFGGANLLGADLRRTRLKGANLAGAQLGTADLRDADLADVTGWDRIASVSYTNIEGVRNPPPGFREWALGRGAVDRAGPDIKTGELAFSTVWRAV